MSTCPAQRTQRKKRSVTSAPASISRCTQVRAAASGLVQNPADFRGRSSAHHTARTPRPEKQNPAA